MPREMVMVPWWISEGPAIGAIEIYAKCFIVEEAVESLENSSDFRVGCPMSLFVGDL